MDDTARSFGAVADAYDRARPDYPTVAVEDLARRAGLDRGRVVDVGAGTGKLSALLAARAGMVVAVEPLAGMREVLAGQVPAARVVGGVAEALPLRDGSAQVLTVAQAFHWFDGPAALAEFARVLAPGGALALVWNVRDESDALQQALSALIRPHRGKTPSYRTEAWRGAFAHTQDFGPLETRTFPHSQRCDRRGLVERMASTSFVANLEPPTQREVLEQVAGLFDEHADDGEVALLYETRVHVARRR